MVRDVLSVHCLFQHTDILPLKINTIYEKVFIYIYLQRAQRQKMKLSFNLLTFNIVLILIMKSIPKFIYI